MNLKKRLLGCKGEDLAVEFLKENKYKILDRNFRTKYGEIDIVAKEGKVVCFVEVKTRTSDKFGVGLEAVDASKQGRIVKSAIVYIEENSLDDCAVRFDVVSVGQDLEGVGSVEIFRNAFEADY